MINERKIEITAAIGLLIGGILGMAGSFAPTDSLRTLAWGIDGIGLIIAGALLTVYYFRQGLDMTGIGFLVFAIGESLILVSSGINLDDHVSLFGAGTSLWAASLCIISLQKTFSVFTRITGAIAAFLFAIVSVLIFTGHPVNALTQPLPFFAYPFFAMTIFGWSWKLLRVNHRIEQRLIAGRH